MVNGTFGFSLNNDGDTVTLSCGGNAIDVVAYDAGDSYPNDQAASISRSNAPFEGANPGPQAWCLGQEAYLAEPEHRGTPGVLNPICPVEVNPGQ